MRLVGLCVAACAFGWALLAAAETRTETPGTLVVHRLVTVEVQPDAEPNTPTPVADALVDWDEVDRQTDCLWVLLQREQVEITLEVVIAAGVWTDALGGACRVIGEDDE
jgi:hypothetical protein